MWLATWPSPCIPGNPSLSQVVSLRLTRITSFSLAARSFLPSLLLLSLPSARRLCVARLDIPLLRVVVQSLLCGYSVSFFVLFRFFERSTRSLLQASALARGGRTSRLSIAIDWISLEQELTSVCFIQTLASFGPRKASFDLCIALEVDSCCCE